mgnify:CR=1 FL=1
MPETPEKANETEEEPEEEAGGHSASLRANESECFGSTAAATLKDARGPTPDRTRRRPRRACRAPRHQRLSILGIENAALGEPWRWPSIKQAQKLSEFFDVGVRDMWPFLTIGPCGCGRSR